MDDEEKRKRQRAYERAWYVRNREKIRQQKRDNREERLAKARQAYHRDRDARLARNMLSSHGMYPEDWARIWEAQNGQCYLGGEPLDELGPRFVHVDHDHSCCPIHFSCPVCRRGLACHNCNTLIGLAGDDPDRLRRIADALEAAQAAVENRKAAMSEQLTLDIG